MDTIYERRLRNTSRAICARPDWIEAIRDADARADWAAKAKAEKVTDLEFRYVLAELEFYASLHSPKSNIRLSAADGVWLSDSLIAAETAKELREHAAVLENVPDSQKDWHPKARSRVLNLIDPSLYPLIYTLSWLHRQPIASPRAALTLETLGEQPGNLDEWRRALGGTGDNRPKYHLSVVDEKKALYASGKFSWLPSEFCVDNSGGVTIESYSNNLHPVRHAALYSTIASVFAKFLPLLEQVLTDLVHPRKPGVELDLDRTVRTSQELGGIDIKNGLCVVLPNTYQCKLPRVMREIGSKPSHCKMLTFYYVDPSKHIPSTEIVLPQQGDWWKEQVRESELLCNLLLLVVDGIMDKIDYPISLKNAKQICLEMEAEVKEKTANVSSKFFVPLYSIKLVDTPTSLRQD
ncbi:hypothetical protein GGI06_001894 [Coemansia sp. S85]|nr:hypothetical protein GGI06_001894 [Coemansia sp. S85]